MVIYHYLSFSNSCFSNSKWDFRFSLRWMLKRSVLGCDTMQSDFISLLTSTVKVLQYIPLKHMWPSTRQHKVLANSCLRFTTAYEEMADDNGKASLTFMCCLSELQHHSHVLCQVKQLETGSWNWHAEVVKKEHKRECNLIDAFYFCIQFHLLKWFYIVVCSTFSWLVHIPFSTGCLGRSHCSLHY
jgi:hypothetical protein